MRSIPSRLQAVLAGSLAETRDGGERLLKLAEQARRAIEPAPTADPARQAPRHEARGGRVPPRHPDRALPPVEVATQRLIHTRAAAFDRAKASPARGKEVFARHCAACHQINGQGGLVGPQLDGVGNRGHERIVEDVLDPSRNVDPAFYATLLALNDGRTLSGFVRRREGINIVLVDSTGKEQSIPAADVEQERPTKLSPMPANFGVALAESELNDLLAFLIAGSRELPLGLVAGRADQSAGSAPRARRSPMSTVTASPISLSASSGTRPRRGPPARSQRPATTATGRTPTASASSATPPTSTATAGRMRSSSARPASPAIGSRIPGVGPATGRSTRSGRAPATRRRCSSTSSETAGPSW